MRLARPIYMSALALAALLLAMSVLTGCAQPTATPLPPVTVVKPQPTAPVAAPPQQPTAASAAQAPTAYVGPPTANPDAVPVATNNPYPEPTIPAQAAATDRQAFSVTILHVNDVYGEIDPCG